jgi:excisionase family DNA binding protein
VKPTKPVEIRYCSVQQVATMLAISVDKVLLMVRQKALPSVRVGHLIRIPAKAFDAQFPGTP